MQAICIQSAWEYTRNLLEHQLSLVLNLNYMGSQRLTFSNDRQCRLKRRKMRAETSRLQLHYDATDFDLALARECVRVRHGRDASCATANSGRV